MKGAEKKHHAFTEHYLVPLALFALNVCVVHVIHAYSTHSWTSHLQLIALTGSPLALGSALWLKNRNFLICSIVGYLLLLLCW